MNSAPSILSLFICVLLWNTIPAQVNLHTESFETDGEGTRYSSNTYVNGNDFFERTNLNPHTSHASTLTNTQGSYWWASEDVISSPSFAAGNLDITGITITNYENLTVGLYMATSNNSGTRWEDTDFITISAQIDAGGYSTVGQFVGNMPFGGDLQADADLNGVADGGGATLNAAFTQYNFSISGTGNSLDIRVSVNQDGGSEEFAFDLIEVEGTVVLPVSLSEFTAQAVPEGNLLTWRTEREVNNDYFELERSANGQDFEALLQVAGSGNTQSPRSYSALDTSPSAEELYYRLKQVDFDGQFTYSSVVKVDNSHFASPLQLLPNPSSGLIQIQSPQALRYLEIQEISTGRILYKKANLRQKVMAVNLEHLPEGLYLAKYHMVGGSWGHELFVIQK